MKKKKYSNKRQRFLEIGEARTNSILERIRILGNCANRNLYEYREEEINKIFRSLQKALDEARTKFMIQRKKKKNSFKL